MAVARGSLVDKALAVGTIEPRVEVSVKSILAGVVRQRWGPAHIRSGNRPEFIAKAIGAWMLEGALWGGDLSSQQLSTNR